MNVNYTLLDILNNNIKIYNKETDSLELLAIENGIEIPMIQRDYAQGRVDEKTTFIREKFLTDIHYVLKSNQEGNNLFLKLDFVYGYVENSTFIPLDGQQRLTTLYIIHWFLAFKDKVEFTSIGLHKFNYKTRQSAKEFFKSINNLENQFKVKEECEGRFDKLIYVIKNQPWYNLKWDFDPTVKGILRTLTHVVDLFSDISFSTLIQGEQKPLSFHFLKIDEYGLGDNLYIKMNARGKPLSDFENFKASFENIISNKTAISKEFINKIDGVWLDSFWVYSLKSLPILKVNEDVELLTKKCDFLMLEVIKKFTEYLFFKNDIDEYYDFTSNDLEKIYSSEENLVLLNRFLDLVCLQNYDEWTTYFDEIFSEKMTKNKVATNLPTLNFVQKIFSDEAFSHFENLLFYGWLNFILRTNTIEISGDLKDFLRIIRNFINNINQKNKTSLDTELRTDYYTEIIEIIEKIEVVNPYSKLDLNVFSNRQRYIQYEINKYDIFKDDDLIKELLFKFEDHSSLRGLVFNFDFSNYNINEIENIVLNFNDMFNHLIYQDIIRLFLCFGDYSVKVGSSNLGLFRFFGEKGKWNRVLASPDGEIKPNFIELFKIFSKSKIENWHEFIETTVSNHIMQYENNWLWYCMKNQYKTILDHPIFTRNNENKIEIFYNQSLNSYHNNPFVFWFRFHSPLEIRKNIDEFNSCAQYSNYSLLHLKNGIQLEQIDNSWSIYNLDKDFKNEIIKFDDKKDCFVLECQNLIDDLIPFIELLNNINNKPLQIINHYANE
ncbi:DUF262 domain-containing protein [Flavobacterium sp. WC2430]|uniref:GmrSD restriction endonuclease domain-containing protein n=1 Tax=Flavobacterium sp. WC2430 TaxID=3234137 RepID=UPI003467B37C